MKRIVSFLIMFLCVSMVCFAGVKKINIQGGYDSVAAINITPIASQAEKYKIGMPFSIDDSSVRYAPNYNGRLIANWNVLTNFGFLLDVDAEVMHFYEESDSTVAYQSGLGYKLVFLYNISYYKDNVLIPIPDARFEVNVPVSSNNIVSVSDIDLLFGQDIDPNSLVGGADGEIYFCFDQNTTTNKIANASEFSKLKNGNYLANVTLKIKVR